MSTFKKDLETGKIYENKVLDLIKPKYPKAHILEVKHSGWDIYIPEIDKAIEVKADLESERTGNFVIEVAHGGTPSALSTTLADFWVIYDSKDYNWFTPDNIKKCIKETKPKLLTFTARGDSKSKNAYLIKKEVLKKYKIIKKKFGR